VQHFAAVDEQRVVTDLLGQRVLEYILDIGCNWLLVDELARSQLGER